MRFSAMLMLVLTWCASAAAQTVQPRQQPESPGPAFTWGAELDTSSRYVWHGLPYSDGIVVWPSAWISAKGFTIGLLLNIDPHYEPKFNEHDLSVGYEGAIGPLTLSGAFNRYTYRELAGDPGSTSEVILNGAYTAGPGEVFTTHSIDVETYPGAYYAEIGYAVDWAVAPGSLLKVDAGVAFWKKFAEKYDVPAAGVLGPAMLNVALEQKLTDTISVRPHVTLTRLLDRTARRALGTPGVTYGVAIVVAY